MLKKKQSPCRIGSSVRLCWDLEEPKGPNGSVLKIEFRQVEENGVVKENEWELEIYFHATIEFLYQFVIIMVQPLHPKP